MEAPRLGRKLTAAQLSANLVGALLAFSYFTFIDSVPLPEARSVASVAFFIASFSLLAAAASVWANRWARPLSSALPGTLDWPEARRRAVLLPYMVAGVTACAWTLAGLIWGVFWPLVLGHFTPSRALQRIFGITFVAGTVTTAFVFFLIERLWRRELPQFFPEGDMSAVPGVIRLRVKTRLLVIFLMLGTVPLSLLGVLAYRRAVALLTTDPAAAARMVDNMLVTIVFLVVAGVVSAITLAIFVANSVAAPLRDLQAAMGRVRQGDLEASCPVVSNDELGEVAEGFNRMVGGLREREFLKETFGKYVSPEVRDEILSGRLALEGQAREVTILFADLRDFTPWVEATDPREVVRDLNRYFTEMNEAIRRHRGLVLQFIGDEIEAVFGAPVADPAHAALALRAALEMRERLARLNAERAGAGKPPLRHGVGIHTGRVLAGNIGSSERLSYALVGDPVNLASRIQDLNKQLGSDILVSGTTRALLDGTFALTPLPAVRVKGRSVEVEIYRLA
ncbi:MAG TPA: adenylate/guanylate cyclase domain-containing protein [Methylomirabilota bacterium]|nr:adenylate/guanylate cyclase domain-containing protein [Methylomirabilota bacterium]